MELLNAIETRASVRNYIDAPIPIDDLKTIVKYGAMAPSVAGSELCRFTIITDRNALNEMSNAVKSAYDELVRECNNVPESSVKAVETFSTFFKDAPAVIAVFVEEYNAVIDNIIKYSSIKKDDIEETRKYPSIQSAGAAIQNMLLTAHDLGYGACWLTAPLAAREELCKLIKYNKGKELVAMVAIGKPKSPVQAKLKKPLEEVLTIQE